MENATGTLNGPMKGDVWGQDLLAKSIPRLEQF